MTLDQNLLDRCVRAYIDAARMSSYDGPTVDELLMEAGHEGHGDVRYHRACTEIVDEAVRREGAVLDRRVCRFCGEWRVSPHARRLHETHAHYDAWLASLDIDVMRAEHEAGDSYRRIADRRDMSHATARAVLLRTDLPTQRRSA